MKEKKLNEIVEKRFEDRKLETPLYDPYTGEVNVDYEKLTGKVNPLIDTQNPLYYSKKINDYRFENSTHFDTSNLIPITLNFKKNNRFLVNLPTDFEIEPCQIESVSEIKISLDFLNYVKYENINFVIRESEDKSYLNFIMGKIINKEKIILSIDKVNGGNIVIDTVYIEGIVTGASTNNLNYSNDGIYTLTMTLMPLSVKSI
jgi:hypothetical protein